MSCDNLANHFAQLSLIIGQNLVPSGWRSSVCCVTCYSNWAVKSLCVVEVMTSCQLRITTPITAPTSVLCFSTSSGCRRLHSCLSFFKVSTSPLCLALCAYCVLVQRLARCAFVPALVRLAEPVHIWGMQLWQMVALFAAIQIIISTCQTERFTVCRDAISLLQCSLLPIQRNLFLNSSTSRSFWKTVKVSVQP